MGRSKRAGTLRRVKAEEEFAKPKAPVKEKPMRPNQCRTHLNKTLAAEFPKILKGFVEKAKAGGCPHMKLVTLLLEDSMKPKRSRSGQKSVSEWVKAMERCH